MTSRLSSSRPQLVNPVAPPTWLRQAVRGVLEQSQGYQALPSEHRRDLAQAMVRVSSIAAGLIAEERDADAAIQVRGARRPPLARAQDQPEFGAATDRIASTTAAVLGAVSFPRFVTDLINGVFKAMLASNAQQMQSFVELLNNVSASAEGFEKSQFAESGVRQWVADHFPDRIEYDVPEVDPGEKPDPEEVAAVKLRLRDGASMPGEEELRTVLGIGPEESVEAGDPEALIPLARRQISRQRQQMLATMVMLGMQRIVIDSGRINASMRFHIDTRSAATEDRGSQFGMQNKIKASGSFGFGPWGASAEVENTISYVTTQRSQNTEEINTDLDLNSSVELNFHTDYLPLNRMAAQAQADRVRNASLNPTAETADTPMDRRARQDAQRAAEEQRRSGLLTNPAIPAPVAPAPAVQTPSPVAPGQGGKPATNAPATASPPANRAPVTQARPTPAGTGAPQTQTAPAAQPRTAPSTGGTGTPAQTSSGTGPAIPQARTAAA